VEDEPPALAGRGSVEAEKVEAPAELGPVRFGGHDQDPLAAPESGRQEAGREIEERVVAIAEPDRGALFHVEKNVRSRPPDSWSHRNICGAADVVFRGHALAFPWATN
jgi:hypothetical protein